MEYRKEITVDALARALSLQSQCTEIEPVARHRRTPEIASGDRQGELESASVMPSSAPTILLSCASKASNDFPNTKKLSPPRMPSAHGIERRNTKASGSKLSCAVRLTWDDAAPADKLKRLSRGTDSMAQPIRYARKIL